MQQNVRKSVPWAQIGALVALGGLCVASRLRNGSWEAPSYAFGLPFCATWLIFGAILGPSGFRRGSQNHVFGHHAGKKQEKGGPGAVPKKHEI